MDLTKLGMLEKKQLKERILKSVEEDNESFLRRLRDRTDRFCHLYIFPFFSFSLNKKYYKLTLVFKYYRVGIEIPKIEVRYKDLSVEGDVYVGSRALPTLLNATLNTIEVSK